MESLFYWLNLSENFCAKSIYLAILSRLVLYNIQDVVTYWCGWSFGSLCDREHSQYQVDWADVEMESQILGQLRFHVTL